MTYQGSKIDFQKELSELFTSELGENGNIIKDSLIEVLENETHDPYGETNGNYGIAKGFKLSPSTRDHFKMLAKVKGGNYKSFFDQHIKHNFVRGQKRIDDLWEYAYQMLWVRFKGNE